MKKKVFAFIVVLSLILALPLAVSAEHLSGSSGWTVEFIHWHQTLGLQGAHHREQSYKTKSNSFHKSHFFIWRGSVQPATE